MAFSAVPSGAASDCLAQGAGNIRSDGSGESAMVHAKFLFAYGTAAERATGMGSFSAQSGTSGHRILADFPLEGGGNLLARHLDTRKPPRYRTYCSATDQ